MPLRLRGQHFVILSAGGASRRHFVILSGAPPQAARSRRTPLVADARGGDGISGLGGRSPHGRGAGHERKARGRHASCTASDPSKSGSQGPMGKRAHRPVCLWFVHQRVRLTKPPQIAGAPRAGSVLRPRLACGSRPPRPAAIGAGFVRLATGRARIRPADTRGRAGWRARHVRRPTRAHEKTRFLFKKRGLGTVRRPRAPGRPRRRGRELGKRLCATFRRAPSGREAPSDRPRNAPFPSQTAILERERGNMGAAPPFSKGCGAEAVGQGGHCPAAPAGPPSRQPAAARRPRSEAASIQQIRPIGRPRSGKVPSMVKTRPHCRYRKRRF